jgi:hypothetical protein
VISEWNNVEIREHTFFKDAARSSITYIDDPIVDVEKLYLSTTVLSTLGPTRTVITVEKKIHLFTATVINLDTSIYSKCCDQGYNYPQQLVCS